MIDYVGLNCFVGACLVWGGFAIGWVVCSFHYRRLLNDVAKEHNIQRMIDKDTISLLQDEARHWHTQVLKRNIQELLKDREASDAETQD